MVPQIIGIKELQNNLSRVQEQVEMGKYFIVVKRSRPVFSIVPFREDRSLEEDLRQTGLYSEDFIKEMIEAEKDVEAGRVYQVDSLDDLLDRNIKYVSNSNN